MQKRNDVLRQQIPGNSKLFDSRLSPDHAERTINRTTVKTMHVLRYFRDVCNCDWVSAEKFAIEIGTYLLKNYDIDLGNTNKMHQARVVLFDGFLEGSDRGYRLTSQGNLLLYYYDKGDHMEATRVYLEQLANTKYPNLATKRLGGDVKCRPHRMLFCQLLKYGSLSLEYVCSKLPYFVNSSCLNEKGELDIKGILSGEYYDKFYTWRIKSFQDMGLISINNGRITIGEEYKDLIKYYFDFYKDIDFFHDEGIPSYMLKTFSNNRVYCDSRLVELVKERDGCTCRLTGVKGTWLARADGRPICYVHHILPVEFLVEIKKKFGIDVDSMECMIVITGEMHDVLHKAMDRQRGKWLRKCYDILPERHRNLISWEEFCRYYDYKENYQTEIFDFTG
jgi:hypothetical protein